MSDDTPIDLVFVDFVQVQLLQILNSVQMSKSYTAGDVKTFSPILANAALGLYVQKGLFYLETRVVAKTLLVGETLTK